MSVQSDVDLRKLSCWNNDICQLNIKILTVKILNPVYFQSIPADYSEGMQCFFLMNCKQHHNQLSMSYLSAMGQHDDHAAVILGMILLGQSRQLMFDLLKCGVNH